MKLNKNSMGNKERRYARIKEGRQVDDKVDVFLGTHLAGEFEKQGDKKERPRIVLLGEDGSMSISYAISNNTYSKEENVKVIPMHILNVGERQAMMLLKKELKKQGSLENRNIIIVGSYRETNAPELREVMDNIMKSSPEMIEKGFINTIYFLGVKHTQKDESKWR